MNAWGSSIGVRKSDPFRTLAKSIGGTGPEALPKLTIMPNGRSHSIERSNVSFAHRIVDDGNTGPLGDLLHAIQKVFPAVIDHVMAAMRPGELRFLVRPNGPDRGDTERGEPLAGNQSDATGRCVPYHGVARLYARG